MIILPGQARDKHGENTQKRETTRFLIGGRMSMLRLRIDNIGCRRVTIGSARATIDTSKSSFCFQLQSVGLAYSRYSQSPWPTRASLTCCPILTRVRGWRTQLWCPPPSRAGSVRAKIAPARNAPLSECFPYVCPEPVLVKKILFKKSKMASQKKCGFSTPLWHCSAPRPFDPAALARCPPSSAARPGPIKSRGVGPHPGRRARARAPRKAR